MRPWPSSWGPLDHRTEMRVHQSPPARLALPPWIRFMSSTPDGSPVARAALVSTAANPLAEASRCRYRRRGHSSTSSRQQRHSLISTSHHFQFSSFVKQEDPLLNYTLFPCFSFLSHFTSFSHLFLSSFFYTSLISFLAHLLSFFLLISLPSSPSSFPLFPFLFPLVYFLFLPITVRIFHLLAFRVLSFCFRPLFLPLSFNFLVSFPFPPCHLFPQPLVSFPSHLLLSRPVIS